MLDRRIFDITWAVVKAIEGGLSSGGRRGRRRGSCWGRGALEVGSKQGLGGTVGAGLPTWGLSLWNASVWARGFFFGVGAGERRAADAAPTLWWRLKDVWAQVPRRRSVSSEAGEGGWEKDGPRNWRWA